jgi:hypothetical protein
MFYLIDGYNLLHALGLPRQLGPAGLEKARRRLLDFLKRAYGDEAPIVTVVFDAARAPRGVPAEVDHQGLHVRFAVGHAQADDLIELLIRQAAAPRQLTVVSDDHRLQKAARRRRCTVVGCGDYLLWLGQRRKPRPAPPAGEPAKPSGVSRQEAQHWLNEFADLADDPDLKELFDPYGFLEDEGGPP